MSRTIDLNVDAGESFGAWSMGDAGAMFDLVTTMNVAAGFHAGDPGTIGRTFEPPAGCRWLAAARTRPPASTATTRTPW